jgi:hypothetical protein
MRHSKSPPHVIWIGPQRNLSRCSILSQWSSNFQANRPPRAHEPAMSQNRRLKNGAFSPLLPWDTR